MIPIPTLETERLIMRAPGQQDLDAYADFYASERSHMVGGPLTRIEVWRWLASVIGHWQLRGFGRWMLDEKNGSTSIGLVGLHYPEGWPEAEIGWTMFSGEGKGYAFEAAQAARRYAYDTLGWTTAVSLINPANTRSLALGKRMGVTHDYDYEHPQFGTLAVWRHPSPEALQ